MKTFFWPFVFVIAVVGVLLYADLNSEVPDTERIAYRAMRDFLRVYEKGVVNPGGDLLQINDFRVEKVVNAQFKDGSLYFYVVFSIKPVNPLSETIGTDNGTREESSGWIVNKSGSAFAKEENGGYVIKEIATGVAAGEN